MTGSQFVQALRGATQGEWEKAVLDAVGKRRHVDWPMRKIPCGPNSYFFAATDYLAIGTPQDFVRVPLGGPIAQTIADRLGFLLPTAKMVDRVWVAAKTGGIVLAPMSMAWNDPQVPMTSVEATVRHNSKVQMALDHLAYVPGSTLVAGLKKDVILSPSMKDRPGKLAFYGWHRLDGTAIQGNSYAHEAGYFDYSHGVRFVSPNMVHDGRSVSTEAVLEDPALCTLISGDGILGRVRYGAMNPITLPPTIKRGSKGSAVMKWQGVVGATIDGEFGPKTEALTKIWQARHHITADGIVGPKTWAAWLRLTEEPTMPEIDTNIPFVQAKHSNRLAGRVVTMIVIHTMEYPERAGGAEWCADFFAGNKGMTAPKASAHYCADNDSIVQCVKDEDVAWHVPGKLRSDFVNNFAIGIELAGYAKQTPEEWGDAYSQSMLRLTAQLVARLCKKHEIPAVKLSIDELKAGNISGLCGHVDCTKATGTGSHWDPGPNFPWDDFIAMVQAYL